VLFILKSQVVSCWAQPSVTSCLFWIPSSQVTYVRPLSWINFSACSFWVYLY